MKFYKIFILLACVCLCSCKKTQSKDIDPEYLSESANMVKKWMDKKMILPTDIEFLNNPSNYKKPIEFLDQPLKIVVTIEGDCGACISSFDFWERFHKKLVSEKINCKIFVFVDGYDKKNLQQYIEKLNLGINCFYDKEAKFRSSNGLYDKRFQAALLDKDNKVIIIGNPILNQELSDLYFETLNDLNEN